MIKLKCQICNEEQDVRISEEEHKDWTLNHRTLPLIQNHFKWLDEDEREMLLTGICGVCWDKLGWPEDAA